MRTAWMAAPACLVLLGACAGENVQEIHEEALRAARHNRRALALDLFRRALKEAPDDIAVHRDYQNFMRKIGREADLLAEYGRRLREDPNNAVNLYLFGRLQKGEKLEEYMKRSMAADPGFFWPRYALALYYKNVGRHAEALRHFRWIFRRYDPAVIPEELHLNAAISLQRTGDVAGALFILNRAGTLFPRSPLPSFYRGLMELSEGRTAEGIRALRISIQRDEDFYKAYAPLVQALHARERFDEAREFRERARAVYARRAIPELADDFVIHLARMDGWALKVTERLDPGREHPLEKGNWRFVADWTPLDEKRDLRVRYVLRVTGGFRTVVLRRTTTRDGTQSLEPVKAVELPERTGYRAFYEFVVKDGRATMERLGN